MNEMKFKTWVMLPFEKSRSMKFLSLMQIKWEQRTRRVVIYDPPPCSDRVNIDWLDLFVFIDHTLRNNNLWWYVFKYIYKDEFIIGTGLYKKVTHAIDYNWNWYRMVEIGLYLSFIHNNLKKIIYLFKLLNDFLLIIGTEHHPMTLPF